MSGIKADQHGNMADAYISEKWRNIYIYRYIHENRLKNKGKEEETTTTTDIYL